MKKITIIAIALLFVVETVFAGGKAPEGVTTLKESSKFGSVGPVWIEDRESTLHVAGKINLKKRGVNHHVDVTLLSDDNSVIARESVHIVGGSDGRSAGSFKTNFDLENFTGVVKLELHKCNHGEIHTEIHG